MIHVHVPTTRAKNARFGLLTESRLSTTPTAQRGAGVHVHVAGPHYTNDSILHAGSCVPLDSSSHCSVLIPAYAHQTVYSPYSSISTYIYSTCIGKCPYNQLPCVTVYTYIFI